MKKIASFFVLIIFTANAYGQEKSLKNLELQHRTMQSRLRQPARIPALYNLKLPKFVRPAAKKKQSTEVYKGIKIEVPVINRDREAADKLRQRIVNILKTSVVSGVYYEFTGEKLHLDTLYIRDKENSQDLYSAILNPNQTDEDILQLLVDRYKLVSDFKDSAKDMALVKERDMRLKRLSSDITLKKLLEKEGDLARALKANPGLRNRGIHDLMDIYVNNTHCDPQGLDLEFHQDTSWRDIAFLLRLRLSDRAFLGEFSIVFVKNKTKGPKVDEWRMFALQAEIIKKVLDENPKFTRFNLKFNTFYVSDRWYETSDRVEIKLGAASDELIEFLNSRNERYTKKDEDK